mgnify:CR=1 FL=1
MIYIFAMYYTLISHLICRRVILLYLLLQCIIDTHRFLLSFSYSDKYTNMFYSQTHYWTATMIFTNTKSYIEMELCR